MQVKPRVGPLLAVFQSSGRKENFPCCYTLLIISLWLPGMHRSTTLPSEHSVAPESCTDILGALRRGTEQQNHSDAKTTTWPFFFFVSVVFFLVYVFRNPDRGYFSLPMKTSTSLVHVLSLLLLISQRYLPRWSCVAWGI